MSPVAQSYGRRLVFHIITLRRAVFKSLMRRPKNSMYPDYNTLGKKHVEPLFIINTPGRMTL
jgi:hypothetical protein